MGIDVISVVKGIEGIPILERQQVYHNIINLVPVYLNMPITIAGSWKMKEITKIKTQGTESEMDAYG